MNQLSRTQNILYTSRPSTNSSRAIGPRIRLSPSPRPEGGSRAAMPQITLWMLLLSTRCIGPPPSPPATPASNRAAAKVQPVECPPSWLSSGYPILLYALVLTTSLLFRISDSDSPPLLSSTRPLRFTYSGPVLCSSPPDSSCTEREGSRRLSCVQSAYVHSHFQYSQLPFQYAVLPGLLIVGLDRYNRVSLLSDLRLVSLDVERTHSCVPPEDDTRDEIAPLVYQAWPPRIDNVGHACSTPVHVASQDTVLPNPLPSSFCKHPRAYHCVPYAWTGMT